MKKTEISKITRELIASNKLQEVFDILMNYAKNDEGASEFLNRITLLMSRYNQVRQQRVNGILPYAEERVELNKVMYALLEIIDELDKKIEQIEIYGNKNIVISSITGSKINIDGDFRATDEIAKADESVIQKLIQGQSIIKILFLSSNPIGTDPLRLDKEMREIDSELVRSKYRDKFELIKFSALRISDLQDALLNNSPNFVHFSGHGNTAGIALLNNTTDETQFVQSEPLANLFKLFSNDIACVFLNSCYSEIQAKLIRKFIPKVIGMKQSVPDITAIEFAKVFYKAIGAGREISFSFEFAKVSIDLNNISGSDIPVIL